MVSNTRKGQMASAPKPSMMYCAHCQQRTYWQVVSARHSVTQYQVSVAFVGRVHCFFAYCVQGFGYKVLIGYVVFDVEDYVYGKSFEVSVLYVLENEKVFERKNGLLDEQAFALFGRRLQDVRLRSDGTRQRHDDFLAYRINRRIGHLGKQLLKQQQAQHFNIVAEQRKPAVLLDQHILFLARQIGPGHHASAHNLLKVGILRAINFVQVLDCGQFADPILDRPQHCHLILDLNVAGYLLFEHIGQQHASRLQPTLLHHLTVVHINDAYLARHHQVLGLENVVARRSEAVAVENGANVAAVGEGQQCWTVPRLHGARVPLVVGFFQVAHELVALPRFGHHGQHGLGQRPLATLNQKLYNIVQTARVGQILLHHREQVVQLVAKLLACHDAFAGVHVVHIASESVYLAIVGHVPVRMGAFPARKCVCRKSGMHQCQIDLVAWRFEVQKLLGRHQALVDQSAGRKAAYVAIDAILIVDVGGALAHYEYALVKVEAVARMATRVLVNDKRLFDERLLSAIFSNSIWAWRGFSRGIKITATAYSPLAGSWTPDSSSSLRNRLSGMVVMTPAPSPVLSSQPQAPRCAIRVSIFLASSMT
ncbi:Biopolymer transport exbB [Brachionus plicatilis]|uniref:Biopolymer transport exbB n=1 Tax=Brachionus plicatilis TaxID=10195 RepID=A0A3M7SIJ9_BRAPC|nr:Biopolymer transport exbB [Brachionus plicatilis]